MTLLLRKAPLKVFSPVQYIGGQCIYCTSLREWRKCKVLYRHMLICSFFPGYFQTKIFWIGTNLCVNIFVVGLMHIKFSYILRKTYVKLEKTKTNSLEYFLVWSYKWMQEYLIWWLWRMNYTYIQYCSLQ